MALILDHRDKLPLELVEVINSIDSTLSGNDVESFWDCREYFDRICENEQLWADIINECVLEESASGEAKFESSGLWQNESLSFHYDNNFHIRLTDTATNVFDVVQKYDSEEKTLVNGACHLMMAFITKSPMTLNRYELSEGHNFDVFDKDCKLTLKSSEKVIPYKRYEVNGYSEVIGFDNIGNEGALLVMNSRPVLSQQCEFDRETLKIMGASISSVDVSIILSILEQLSRYRHSESTDVVKKLLNNPSHYIRWAAIKCLSQLSPEESINYIREAKSDKHPHIRDAANRTMYNLEAG